MNHHKINDITQNLIFIVIQIKKQLIMSIMSSVTGVALGKQNKQEANAPEGSKPQSDIILYKEDGSWQKNGSGWEIWKVGDVFYHLGGLRKDKKPHIYVLTDNGSWSIQTDQSEAWSRYDNYEI